VTSIKFQRSSGFSSMEQMIMLMLNSVDQSIGLKRLMLLYSIPETVILKDIVQPTLVSYHIFRIVALGLRRLDSWRRIEERERVLDEAQTYSHR